MNPIQECYTITKEIVETLQNTVNYDRDIRIQKVEDFLEKRQQILESIKPPFSDEDQLLGEHLVLLGKKFDGLLMNLKLEIKRDMNGLNKKKKSMNQYTNPYANLQSDGFFYDKRK
ncbi:flagellar protein FliT [Heyndrickxia oleronia]|jgi:flagellar protein FliT|uniref:flagellar protein FliT n=1 Tax=Heyndrickxia oleronia TaxID=38875 RepID=UPI002431CAB0|nr:flagellar protein FliT [Heyndrickxia oleronia]MCI1592520.1 flagellar protein FliT [Heyndrickxia oleronia]MCI1615378.1 flagellar protein FliT [Heyndrickxia oleronia]MCI1746224.1 flagellar protein FliT [Heyndrickxia oleronia]MCI1763665.1 flagellar protein FliT [Heyndrickxia oleronia]